MTKHYSLGFMSRSRSIREMRSPIWYKHLTEENVDHTLIKEFFFEENFGHHTFQESADDYLTQLGCRIVDRLSLLMSCDIVVSLKPTDEWRYMRPGSTLIGWFNHLNLPPQNSVSVKFLDLEDIKISVQGRQQKLLYRNACVAGECGVAQTLEELRRLDPSSPAIKEGKLAVVLGYGNLGTGATMELLAQGIEKVVVFTQRSPVSIEDKLEGVEHRQMKYESGNTYEVFSDGLKQPLIAGILSQADIIVNATIPSSPNQKWTFIPENKLDRLKSRMAFIDPVHQPGHGVNFAGVTQLSAPLELICKSNNSIWYNGCNAMPSYRPAYASYIISQALLSNLDRLVCDENPESFSANFNYVN